MKHIFIVNMNSGVAKIREEKIKEINQICIEYKLDYEIHKTYDINEATKIALLSNKSGNIIYSVGGDGTLNKIINTIVLDESVVQIIPTGSGNDTFKSVYGPNHILDLKKAILKGENISIDLGEVNQYSFVNIASIGLDAKMAANVEMFRNWKILSSKAKYNASILWTLLTAKPIAIKKSNNENISKFMTLVAICNGKYYGDGVKISPNSQIEDGKFHIIAAEELSKLQMAILLAGVKQEKHLLSDKVNEFITNQIDIDLNEELCCNIDGEIIYNQSFSFACRPKALTLRK